MAQTRTRFLSVSVLLLGGCYSGLTLDANSGGSGADSAGSGADSSADTDADTGDDDGGYDQSELPAPTTRLFRLTHRQWENTIRDLFYLADHTGLSEHFRSDPAGSGYLFENNAQSLEVDGALWSGYQRAAADVAELVTSDPTIASGFLPPDGGDDAVRARSFIEEFGARAFRRPLTGPEVDELLALFETGPDLYSAVDGFDAGVRIVVETMLQSPHFLYRIERSTEPSGDVIVLDDYEVASRLSYFLWNTMPDDELFEAAGSGTLTTVAGVEPHARRLLADPRAIGVVELFHDTMFDVEAFEGIAPSPAFFPDAPATLGASAQTELRMFVQDLVFEQAGSVADLMTSNRTFVNADLAAIYGLEGDFGSTFEAVELDPSQRSGLLTQVGFLARNASSVNPDPIHRGVFVAEHITCTHIPAPPDGVPPLPPPEGKSNRQTVEEHTEQPGTDCVSCHSTVINPYGFVFENYDATGAFRTIDNGFEVDASATVILAGEQIAVQNAVELMGIFADSPRVHGCYLEHWVQYAHGRPAAPEDGPLVERLATTSTASAASVQDLLVDIVTSQPFLTRSTEELP
jgi:hypothetical protein